MSKLIDILKLTDEFSDSSLSILTSFMEKWEVPTFDAILEIHLLSEERLADLLATYYHVERIEKIEKKNFSEESLHLLDYQTAKHLRCLLLRFNPDDQLVLALVDPTDMNIQNYITNLPFEPLIMIAEKTPLEDAIERYYPLNQQLPSLLSNFF